MSKNSETLIERMLEQADKDRAHQLEQAEKDRAHQLEMLKLFVRGRGE